MALDLDAIRRQLDGEDGPRYWRSLEELAGSAQLQEMLEREYPDQADSWSDPVTRRQFLLLLGASLGLAGVAGCTPRPEPAEKILPYVRQPEEIVLGKPLYYATAMTLGGFATGLLVESHEGRPTKIEGNLRHPASLGATDPFGQASILTLYDPDRSRSPTYAGRPRAWTEALIDFRKRLADAGRQGGQGVRILTEPTTSPTLARQFAELRSRLPAMLSFRSSCGGNARAPVRWPCW